MLTSWVRLFDGRFRDPLVGRDLLVGLVLAASLAVIRWLPAAAADWFRLPAFRLETQESTLESLRGLPGALTAWFSIATFAILTIFMMVLIFLVLRLLMRRDVLTLIPMILIGIAFSLGDGPTSLVILSSVIFMSIFWLALFRFGLLSLVVALVASELMMQMPLTIRLTAWWSAPTWVTLASLIFLAVWGFRVSLAGQPIFRERLFES
jgi:serine/threonine-protein kinase